MSKKDFEKFLSEHKEEKEEKEIDWDKQRIEWLDYIRSFYKDVEEWLKPFQNDGSVSYSYDKDSITEDYIGTYDVNVMKITFAGKKVELRPVGTLLIGSKGRIDMDGGRRRVQFVLADKDSKGVSVKVTTSLVGESGKAKKVDDNASEMVREEPDWTWKIVLREPRKISYDEFNEENFFEALMEVANG